MHVHLKRFLRASASPWWVLLLTVAAQAQNFTTITGSKVQDATGTLLAAGQICFLPTDANDLPVRAQAGGGGQIIKNAVCTTVTAGVIGTLSVANPNNTNPVGISYRVTVKDSSNVEVRRDTGVQPTGASWSYDTYVPSSTAVAFTPGTISGSLTVNGSLSVTGTPSFSVPIPVASGGTNVTSAGGAAVDNISGFSSTGFLTRTGSATYAFQSATNGVTLANLAQVATNTILGNATSGTANLAAQSMPSCSSAGNALNWTTNTGFGCNSSITATNLSGTNLTGDVTNSSNATTVAKIQTKTVSGTTGTGNVVFSASPTMSGTVTFANGATYDGTTFTGNATADSVFVSGSNSGSGANFTIECNDGVSSGNCNLNLGSSIGIVSPGPAISINANVPTLKAPVVTGSLKFSSVLFSATAPTISSGFGSSPSVTASNGTAEFEINVGTGGSATNGVIGLPNVALNSWNCTCNDITTQSSTVFLCKQIAGTTSSATIANFNTSGAQAAWVASDKLRCSCGAY